MNEVLQEKQGQRPRKINSKPFFDSLKTSKKESKSMFHSNFLKTSKGMLVSAFYHCSLVEYFVSHEKNKTTTNKPISINVVSYIIVD